MKLTGKQSYVLDHLVRVRPLPFKIITPSQRDRYELDGWECTAQITSLVVKKCVGRSQAGFVSLPGKTLA